MRTGIVKGIVGLLVLGVVLKVLTRVAEAGAAAPGLGAVVLVFAVGLLAANIRWRARARRELAEARAAAPKTSARVAELEGELRVSDLTNRMLLLPMQGTEPVKAASWVNGKLTEAEWAPAAMRTWETAHAVQREQRAKTSVEDLLDPSDERLWLDDFIAAGRTGRTTLRASRRDRRRLEDLDL